MRWLLQLDERLRDLELPPCELLRHAREFDRDVEEVGVFIVHHDGRRGGQEKFEQTQEVLLRPSVLVKLYDLRDELSLLFERHVGAKTQGRPLREPGQELVRRAP